MTPSKSAKLSRSASPPLQAQHALFQGLFAAAQKARTRHVAVRPHRAITPLHVTPWLLAQALVLPLVLVALLLWCKPAVLDLWRQLILFWSPHLGLPFSLSATLNTAGHYSLVMQGGPDGALMPGGMTLLITSVVCAIGLVTSFFMNGATLPLRYPLRIVSVLQGVAVLYFWLNPGAFPYSIGRHSEELMTIGYVVMVSTPVMLAVGYYVLNQRLVVKLFHTALILLFFAVMVPHQVLVQAFLMQHFSVLFMPVLYICMGAVFDALVFVALYSWAVSNAPVDATV